MNDLYRIKGPGEELKSGLGRGKSSVDLVGTKPVWEVFGFSFEEWNKAKKELDEFYKKHPLNPSDYFGEWVEDESQPLENQSCGNCSHFKKYEDSKWGDCTSGFKVDPKSDGLSVSAGTKPKLIGCGKFKIING